MSAAVDIWWLRLDGGAAVAAKYEPLLSPDELERARRFRFDALRTEFIIGHGALRLILADYASAPPDRLEFTRGIHDKPAMKDAAFHFNMSHSGSLLVCAVTAACELGVDVERIRPMPDAEAIANRFFSPAEAARLMSLPESKRDAAFFRCWTRKESFLKATGDGLTRSLSSFEVTFAPAEPARFARIDGDDPALWTLHGFEPAEGYTAALAMPGPIGAVSLREFAVLEWDRRKT